MIIFSFRNDNQDTAPIPDTSFSLSGDRGAVLLIHGLTGTPRELALLAKKLNERGFAVSVPLLASHDKPLAILKRASWHDFYASVRREFVRLSAGGRKVFVGGLSFGALLGLLLAREFPESTAAITCFSPTLFFDGWGMPLSRYLLPFAYYTPLKYYAYFKEENPYGIKNERLRSRIESYYKNAPFYDASKAHLYGYPVIPVSCMYQNFLLARHIKMILPEIKSPIQLCQARHDDCTSPRNSQYIYNRIGSADKKIVYLEDSYHIITADQERQKVAEVTATFFEQHLPR